MADCHALAARLGWLPSYPSFDRNPLELCDEAAERGLEPAEHVVSELRAGRLRFACEDPDDPANHPRVLSLWRANLLGSSSKGHSTSCATSSASPTRRFGAETEPDKRPAEVEWRDEAPTGKLDLFTTIDFRMNGSCVYSDVVLPAATWYEKHDLSSTDLHPFVHPFNARSRRLGGEDGLGGVQPDRRAVQRLAASTSAPAPTWSPPRSSTRRRSWPSRSGRSATARRRMRAGARAHDAEARPGRARLRGRAREDDRARAAGRGAGIGAKGGVEAGARGRRAGPPQRPRERRRPADGRPSLRRDVDVCEAILALSGTTNGRLAVESFRALEEQPGSSSPTSPRTGRTIASPSARSGSSPAR